MLAQMTRFGGKLLHIFAFVEMVSHPDHLSLASSCRIYCTVVCRNSHGRIETKDGWNQKVCKEASATFFSCVSNQKKLVVFRSLITQYFSESCRNHCLMFTPLDRQSRCVSAMQPFDVQCVLRASYSWSGVCYFGCHQHFQHLYQSQQPGQQEGRWLL